LRDDLERAAFAACRLPQSSPNRTQLRSAGASLVADDAFDGLHVAEPPDLELVLDVDELLAEFVQGIPLAELGLGNTFGEEALISEDKRNATVRMLTDGALMRLKKADFLELMK
jgi:CRP-like cAMP-binding protein